MSETELQKRANCAKLLVLIFGKACEKVAYLVGRRVSAMVGAEWESTGVARLHVFELQSCFALNAGIQVTTGLKVSGCFRRS